MKPMQALNGLNCDALMAQIDMRLSVGLRNQAPALQPVARPATPAMG